MVDALTAAEAVATPASVAAAEVGGTVTLFETIVVRVAFEPPVASFKCNLDAVALLFESIVLVLEVEVVVVVVVVVIVPLLFVVIEFC